MSALDSALAQGRALAAATRGRGGVSTWRAIAAPWAVAHLLGLLVPVLVVWQLSTSTGLPGASELRAAFDHWDTRSYVAIAEHGYPSQLDFRLDHGGYLTGFLPGYPLLIRVVMVVVPDAVGAGLIVSAICSAVALFYVARLIEGERDRAEGRFAAWCLALYPFAFFLVAVYTESAFLAAAAASLYYARRGSPGRACLAGALACAVRVTGIALLPALLLEHLLRGRRGRGDARLLLIAAVPLPLLAFGIYTRLHSGDALAYLHAQASPSFSATAAWPWSGARTTWDVVVQSRAPASVTAVFAPELVFGIAGAVVCGLGWWWCWRRRLAPSLAAYSTAVYLLATSLAFWRSVPRYQLAMFPLLILLADATRTRPAWRGALMTASAGLMAFGAAVFAEGRWLG
jgi:hypothetical protein